MKMHRDIPFVGRIEELQQLQKIISEPGGGVIFLCGEPGIGKTALLNRMASPGEEVTRDHTGYIYYETSPEISPDSLMETIMNHAFRALGGLRSSLKHINPELTQWIDFYRTLMIPGFDFREIITVMRPDASRDIQDQFLEKLRFFSHIMPDESRAVFVLDARPVTNTESASSWEKIFRDPPPGIKLVFLLRPEDPLVSSCKDSSLGKLMNIEELYLENLDNFAVSSLCSSCRGKTPFTVEELEKVLSRYRGRPRALNAALCLLMDGLTTRELPSKYDLTKFTSILWNRIQNEHGSDAAVFFETLAVLNDYTTPDVIDAVTGFSEKLRKQLLAARFLRGLIEERNGAIRISCPDLAAHIRKNIDEEEERRYHCRAVEAYLARLKNMPMPDEISAMRLMRHMIRSGQAHESIYAFINVCTPRLIELGLYELSLDFSRGLLKIAPPDSLGMAALFGNLGVIYKSRGKLDTAEKMERKALRIYRAKKHMQGIAHAYLNLGDVCRLKGRKGAARNMFLNSLNIFNRLKDINGMTRACGSLGVIYMEQGNLKLAEQSLKRALAMNKKAGRTAETVNQIVALAGVYLKSGNPEKARGMFRQALDIHNRTGNRPGLAECYDRLGVIYTMENEFRKAAVMYGKAREIRESLGDYDVLAGTLIRLAGLDALQNRRKEAGEKLLEALDLYLKCGRSSMVEKVQSWYNAISEERESRLSEISELRDILSPARDSF